MVGRQLHDERSGITGEHLGLLQHDTGDDDGCHTDEVSGGGDPGTAAEEAPAIMPMNGTLAPQGMNVVVMIVIRRSRSFSMVREAMMPGTPQPTPMSMG